MIHSNLERLGLLMEIGDLTANTCHRMTDMAPMYLCQLAEPLLQINQTDDANRGLDQEILMPSLLCHIAEIRPAANTTQGLEETVREQNRIAMSNEQDTP